MLTEVTDKGVRLGNLLMLQRAGTGFYNAIDYSKMTMIQIQKIRFSLSQITSMVIGDTAYYFSETFKLPLKYVLTQNLTVNFDTVYQLLILFCLILILF